MEINILPIKEPIIRCYQHDAYPLSIMANTDDYLPWFYSNFIQLSYDRDLFDSEKVVFFEFYNHRIAFSSPWIKLQKLFWQTLVKTHINIIDFIVENIDLGFYFYFWCDEFYIPHRNAYNKFHYKHDMMINGYNKEKNFFYISGYNDKMLFSSTEVNFNELEESIKNLNYSSSVEEEYNWDGGIFLLKFNEQANFMFDIENVKIMLYDYLHSLNTSERYRMYSNPIKNHAFGMEFYVFIKKYLELLLENKMGFDIRPFYLIWEHKKCMVLRLRYMQANRYFFDQSNLISLYKSIEQELFVICNLMIKYNISSNKNIVKKVIASYIDIEKKECCLLENILESIK